MSVETAATAIALAVIALLLLWALLREFWRIPPAGYPPVEKRQPPEFPSEPESQQNRYQPSTTLLKRHKKRPKHCGCAGLKCAHRRLR